MGSSHAHSLPPFWPQYVHFVDQWGAHMLTASLPFGHNMSILLTNWELTCADSLPLFWSQYVHFVDQWEAHMMKIAFFLVKIKEEESFCGGPFMDNK